MSNSLPSVVEVLKDGLGVRLILQIDEDLKYFDGHFERFSILPGVVQIHWAVLYAREHLKISGDFAGLEAVKFAAPIVPNSRLQLQLNFDSVAKKLKFVYSAEGRKFSSGRITFTSETRVV